MSNSGNRQPVVAYVAKPVDRSGEAVVDMQVAYDDEVTPEQMARVERAHARIDKTRLRSKTGPAW